MSRHSFLSRAQLLLVASNAISAWAGNLILPELVRRNDNTTQCNPYYYAPVNSQLSSFPNIWEPASILQGDTNAEAKWDSMKGSVPNIPPKGTPLGDFSGLKYPDSDDDCWWTFSKCVDPKLDGVPDDVSEIPEPHSLAYAFDDGPNCSHNAFYDYLVEKGQKATMFYIGSNVLDWPLEAQRAVTDGHEICVHTWSHRYMTGLSSRDVFAELYYNASNQTRNQCYADMLENSRSDGCQPPFGDVDNRIRAIANGLGLRTILWKYDSNDWRVTGTDSGVSPSIVDSNYEILLNDSANGAFDTHGAIFLAHELNNFTMSEAVKYYDRLKAAFKSLVPIQVALNNTQPYVEGGDSLGTFLNYTNSSQPEPSPEPGVGNTKADPGTGVGSAGTTSFRDDESAGPIGSSGLMPQSFADKAIGQLTSGCGLSVGELGDWFAFVFRALPGLALIIVFSVI